MTSETLQRAIRATPFRPFGLIMTDGEQLYISRSELIAHAPGTSTAAVAISDGSFEYLDLLHVTRIVVGPPADDNTKEGVR